MADLHPHQLEQRLAAVGEQLSAAHEEIAIVIVGGAALGLRRLVTRTTTDVDVYARLDEVGPTPHLVSARPLPEPLARAVAKVARDFDMPVDRTSVRASRLFSMESSPMSAKHAIAVDRRLRDAALAACWGQWRALGASLSDAHAGDVTSVVDLEALILMSLALQPVEHRLGDAVAWWAGTTARLVSVQRLRTLARRGPERTASQLAQFASAAAAAGDARWKALAKSGQSLPTRKLKGPEQPPLLEPAALMPRLRAAFGVGAKADILLYLLTAARRDPTAGELAVGLDYTARAVRTAAEDMAAAGLIDGSAARPRRYSVRRASWAGVLLDGEEFLAWRPFSHVFALVAHILESSERDVEGKRSDYLRASAARDVIETHAPAGGADELPPRPKGLGEDYLPAFEGYVGQLAEWLQRNV